MLLKQGTPSGNCMAAQGKAGDLCREHLVPGLPCNYFDQPAALARALARMLDFEV